jgi:hypothetical protein
VCEEPIIYHMKKRRPNFVSIEMHGILKLICVDLSVRFADIPLVSLKKWATDDGRADKDKMMKGCLDRYGMKVDDGNEADALHLYHYAIEHQTI